MEKYECPHKGCEYRFATVGDKRRHLKSTHRDDSKCPNGCTPSNGDTCVGQGCG